MEPWRQLLLRRQLQPLLACSTRLSPLPFLLQADVLRTTHPTLPSDGGQSCVSLAASSRWISSALCVTKLRASCHRVDALPKHCCGELFLSLRLGETEPEPEQFDDTAAQPSCFLTDFLSVLLFGFLKLLPQNQELLACGSFHIKPFLSSTRPSQSSPTRQPLA